MEDKSKHVPNQELSLIQETFIPIEQVNNPLSINIEPVQLVQSKPIELV